MSLRLAAAVIALVLTASTASALTIDAATIRSAGRAGGVMRVKGRLAPAVVATADPVVVQVEHAVLRLPRAAFTLRRNVLTYRGVRGDGGLWRVRIDLRRGRYLVMAAGWPVGDFTSPFAFALGGDATRDCRMLRLTTRGKPSRTGSRRLALATPTGPEAGCDRLGIPRTTPVAVPAGTPTAVAFAVDVAPAAGIDPASLRVVPVDAPDAPLCTPVAVAGPLPGRFACTATIDVPEPTGLRLMVTGETADGPVVSEGFALPVVGPVTDDVLHAVVAAADALEPAWQTAAAKDGDSLAARRATIAAVRALPGVADARLAPGGRDIALRYVTGWLGLLLLNRPDTPAEAAPAAVPASVPRHVVASPQAAPRGIFRSCDDGSGSDAMCCTPDERTLLEGRDVLIWNPGFFRSGLDDAPVVEDRLNQHACLGFNVTKISGAAADVDSVHEFPKYATLVLSTHGGLDGSGRVNLATGEPATLENIRKRQADYDRGLLTVAATDSLARGILVLPTKAIVAVSEDYFLQKPVGGRFPEHAIVYASACYSAAGNLPNIFTGAFGAGAYFGFDQSVIERFTTTTVAPQLFDGLLKHLRTTGRAYQKVAPKVDPFPHAEVDPVSGTIRLVYVGARFVMAGDDAIAYVDAPKLASPADPLAAGQQATLTVEAEGKGSCELTHHWHNTAEHGHLGGGDDVEGTDAEQTYTAAAAAEGGTDDVGAEVLPPDSDEPLGVACAAVPVVATCGDGVRQDTEECDGDDAPTCPGLCGGDCTCGSPSSTLQVEIQGLQDGVPWKIEHVTSGTPRISCPGTCSYTAPSGPHGITQLRVWPTDDPRTGDPPYDVEGFEGCAGTGGVPAPSTSCYLNGTEPKVVVKLRYRPIVAVTMAGSAGQSPQVAGNPVSPFVSLAVGFACRGSQLTQTSCARHFPVGQGVAVQTATSNPPDFPFPIELLSWSGPCAGQGLGPGTNLCTFQMGASDVCITTTFGLPAGYALTPVPYVGPTCPTGPAGP